jgi:hypothetical protein
MRIDATHPRSPLEEWLLITSLLGAVLFAPWVAPAAQEPVSMGSTAPFGVLAATTVTTIPTTTINGDLGVHPGDSVTGEPIVNGTLHLADPIAAQAKLDLTTAYNDAAGRTLAAVTVAGNLGGLTLAPGLYKSATSLEISSGDLTLDAEGDEDGVWIFQMGSTLVTTVGRQVILSGGARAENIFWQVGSSATIGGSSVFKGNILADQSVTMGTGAILDGRALARNGEVALDANTITVPNAANASVILVSAGEVTDSFTRAAGHFVNLETRTITVPLSPGRRFYRIQSATALTLANLSFSGGSVVITYE